ncbi:lactoylglutathione lyase [Asaia krungthepensis NRIC 0535]|uniref:Lactoylglutathione lyase n=1 Tax=Asaia krungthepensis NRIC 0535 TaxID=1307925 RepID=A0ABQ0Q2F6_9PROT|nr:lactoylglutathione lyase [Asaia krungthepensis NRIC 0535]
MSDAPLISGINHVTLCVGDLERSIRFYRDLLGCVLRARWGKGAYMEAGSLWLCLEVHPEAILPGGSGDSHLAFSVEQDGFTVLCARLSGKVARWKENRSEGDSLYFLDPDGHKLEIHVGTLATRLRAWRDRPPEGLVIQPQED